MSFPCGGQLQLSHPTFGSRGKADNAIQKVEDLFKVPLEKG